MKLKLKPGFHIIVTIVWIAVNDSSDPNDRNDYMETRLKWSVIHSHTLFGAN